MKTLTRETLPEHITELLKNLKEKRSNLVLLKGNLGMGKTTCVQEIARQLGVVGIISSPTFVLLKQYETTDPVVKTLVHIDAYRVTDGTLFTFLELKALLDKPQTLVCVEWSEYIPELGHYPHALVQLEYESPVTRMIDISFN